MSDEEEESMSEGFSASEDEWKPGKEVRGGESSDDDDSDFEKPPGGASGSAKTNANAGAIRKREQKQPSGIKGASVKKRKPMQSLRAKLYNKYRPPPKTFPTSPTNSASASGSGRVTASKNATTPNESGDQQDDVDNDDTSSDSSVDDYLVNPEDLDLHSSFFNSAGINVEQQKEKSPAPVFDCNAGMANLSDSGSEDNNESSIEDNAKTKAFDFRNLLENANSLERAKETLAKRAAETELHDNMENAANSSALDVNALLALGENQNYATNTESQTIDDGPSKLSKTKSTRVKRHTKTRPASTIVAGGDTDDSDWEEVSGDKQNHDHNESQPDGDSTAISGISRDGNLEIHVDLPTRQPRTNQQKTKDELEMAFKRRLNRDIKDRQLVMHKTSLLCLIARSYRYNKLINDTSLMQAALKLLPSKNAYPTERGTEIKYFQSFITWFKTAIKLNSPNLYPQKCAKSKNGIIDELHAQIKRKEARCKQDMVFLFTILARAMGMHCRLVVNLQPLPLRPAPSDLIPIKLKKETKENESNEAQIESADKKANVKKEVKVTTKAVSKSKTESQIKKEKEKTADNAKNKKIDIKSEVKKEPEFKEVPEKPESSRSRRKVKEPETSIEPTARNKSSGETKAQPTLSKLKNSQKPTEDEVSSKINEEKGVQEKSHTAKSSRIGKEPTKSAKPTGSERSNSETKAKPSLSKLKRAQPMNKKANESNSSDDNEAGKRAKLVRQTSLTVKAAFTPVAQRTRKTSREIRKPTEPKERVPAIRIGSPVVPRVVLHAGKEVAITKTQTENENAQPSVSAGDARSRSKSPKMQISPTFLHTKNYQDKFTNAESKSISSRKSPEGTKLQISPNFLKTKNVKSDAEAVPTKRVLRTRQHKAAATTSTNDSIPQLDGGVDNVAATSKKRPKLEKLQKSRSKEEESDEDFEPSPTKRVKKAPVLPKTVQNLRKDRRVLSTDDEVVGEGSITKRKPTASDMWVEVYSDVEEQWICIDLFKGKLHCIDTIRKAASSSLAYVYAFQNDLSLKDVTARYCPHWTTTVRKSRVEKSWLDEAIAPYLAVRSKREIREDQELRRIHEEKPMPTSISDFKDHPLYALERHLLKFQAIYPPDAPTLGFIRGEAIYARDCVHLLHSREIWLKQARVVKLGEEPYKIVKARPKWDRLTQTVIKDQPLEIFGYWQTQDYDPPTAENGIVPRNAYGNVELFKACMLPKKTVHLRLPCLNRICKKLNIDCANAVVGFDFHQGACHPTFDGFIVCEEFVDQVTAAWYQDQEDQDRKDQEKYEARVYGNWKKLIKGLLIRERLKKKYNF